jgi:hypothetical protein
MELSGIGGRGKNLMQQSTPIVQRNGGMKMGMPRYGY